MDGSSPILNALRFRDSRHHASASLCALCPAGRQRSPLRCTRQPQMRVRTPALPNPLLAKAILPDMGGDAGVSTHDSRSTGLINAWNAMRA